MGAPRIDQINVVVGDAAAAARFVTGLGVDVPEAIAPWNAWNAHHRTVPASISTEGGHDLIESTFGIDLDSSAFAQYWGGLPRSFTGVVLNIQVDERAEVDRLHVVAMSIGGRSLKAPYDAFWGSRYAVVEGPGPVMVGLMSVRDDAQRSEGPDAATLV